MPGNIRRAAGRSNENDNRALLHEFMQRNRRRLLRANELDRERIRMEERMRGGAIRRTDDDDNGKKHFPFNFNSISIQFNSSCKSFT